TPPGEGAAPISRERTCSRPGGQTAKSFISVRSSLEPMIFASAMAPREARGEAVVRELLPGQSVDLLRELHLVGRDGNLHADSLRKLKQVNHLVQLLAPAILDARERHAEPALLDAGSGN